ncbi:MAG: hypothetical protein KJ629_07645 [Candidatus Omnitrophica bacterium]|nr:hypothetical protein [Candidatus Omnitrophota bacterium]MBU2504994.1 hypothetical protein [Candidatus Omnitrophota bacterium]
MIILEKLGSRGGLTLTKSDKEMLLSQNEEEIKQNEERSTEILFALLRGFIHYAVDGEVFGPEKEIKEIYGNTLNENYPEANDLFLNFAKTYWTFKIALRNLFESFESSERWVGLGFLSEVEVAIASIFFHTPGPLKKSYREREKAQREILEGSGVKIDIDEFIAGNPILIREKLKPKSFFNKLFGGKM